MQYRAVVIGGGFYGCVVADYLAQRLDRVLLVEAEGELMTRASYVNQARLHNGYHYPRSFRTAASSRQNLSAFRELFEECVDSRFQALYCVARNASKVSRKHFERFCRTLGMPLREAPLRLRKLFEPKLIDRVYATEEYAFDATVLRRALTVKLAARGVEVRTQTRGLGVFPSSAGAGLKLQGGDEIAAEWIFNCTYAGLDRLTGLNPGGAPRMKYQVTEVALVEVPPELKSLGVTVIDGPFFSTMPFPAKGVHSLTHVRYTPHFTWAAAEEPGLDPYRVLHDHSRKSRFAWMVRDAQRYMPSAADMRHVESLFEIKTLLLQTDVDDARPITFHRDRGIPGVISILGGKIDNVFDVIEFIARELDLK